MLRPAVATLLHMAHLIAGVLVAQQAHCGQQQAAGAAAAVDVQQPHQAQRAFTERVPAASGQVQVLFRLLSAPAAQQVRYALDHHHHSAAQSLSHCVVCGVWCVVCGVWCVLCAVCCVAATCVTACWPVLAPTAPDMASAIAATAPSLPCPAGTTAAAHRSCSTWHLSASSTWHTSVPAAPHLSHVLLRSMCCAPGCTCCTQLL